MTGQTPNLTQHWQALDAAHHVHPFTDTAALNREGVRIITRAEGVYLWDSEGRRLIDGMAGLWCVQVGYGNKELAEVRDVYMHVEKETDGGLIVSGAKVVATT